MNNSISNILLWLAVIPSIIWGFIVGVTISSLFFFIQRLFIWANTDGLLYLIQHFLLAPTAGAILGVYWWIKVAPKNSKIITIIIGILVISIYILDWITAISYNIPYLWWKIIWDICSIIWIYHITSQFYKKWKNFYLF